MTKRLRILCWAALALFVLYFLPGSKYVLADLTGGKDLEGFAAMIKGYKWLAEPAYGLSLYVQSWHNYLYQSLSWLAWIAVAVAAAGAYFKQSFRKILYRSGAGWLVFLTVTAVLLLEPLPGPFLRSPRGDIKVNFHSHTYFSKDGVAGPLENSRYHRNSGFDANYITEHNGMRSYKLFSGKMHGSPLVLPGMQFNTENISLLILADREIEEKDISQAKDKKIKEVIAWAHKKGFAVICPHWWKWGKPSWEELYKWGIDGFEIYNINYRDFPDEERAKLIAFCKEKKLVMTGNTDWKGFGWACNTWNVLDMGKLEPSRAEIVSHVRKHRPVRVLVLEKDEYSGAARYIFEPFAGLYLYFAGADARQLFAWFFWTAVFLLVSMNKHWKKLACAAALFFVVKYDAVYLSRYMQAPGNDAMKDLLLPLLFLLTAGWTALALRFFRREIND